MAAQRGFTLQADPLPACQAYLDFLAHCCTLPLAVQAPVFWAIERVYNEGWSCHRPMSSEYEPFAERWGNAGFTQYVDALEKIADKEVARASPSQQSCVHAMFLKVCELEIDFWNMAYDAAV